MFLVAEGAGGGFRLAIAATIRSTTTAASLAFIAHCQELDVSPLA
jgi:hypothetical protein